MKKNKKTQISVMIPAFNEETNITNVLNSLLKQRRTNFELREIRVYSDGSTDQTSEIVKKLASSHPVIKLTDDKNRRGKNFRLNQIFKNCRGEILVVVDADIGIVGRDFLVNLVDILLKDKSAQMVVAHQRLLRPENFMGKLMYAGYLNWDFVRLSVPNQDHVQNFYGAATAYRCHFARTLQIPEGVKEERLYIYLMAKRVEGFRYTFRSEIIYWPVSTWDDFLKLSRRSFGTSETKLKKIFGFDTAEATVVARRYRIVGYLKSLIHQPFYGFLSIGLNLFISRWRPKGKITKSSLWEITPSSKRAIIT